jgi:hypothetical protein
MVRYQWSHGLLLVPLGQVRGRCSQKGEAEARVGPLLEQRAAGREQRRHSQELVHAEDAGKKVGIIQMKCAIILALRLR